MSGQADTCIGLLTRALRGCGMNITHLDLSSNGISNTGALELAGIGSCTCACLWNDWIFASGDVDCVMQE